MQCDVDTLIKDPQLVAAVLPGRQIFGIWRRTLQVPPLWSALAWSGDGSRRAHSGGAMISGPDVEEVTLIRTMPLAVECLCDPLSSADGQTFRGLVTIEVAAVPEACELNALRRELAGGSDRVWVRDVQRALCTDVHRGLQIFAVARPMTALLGEAAGPELSSALQAQLEPVLFRLGLSWIGLRRVHIDAPEHRSEERQRRQDARRLRAERTNAQLAGAQRLAQREHLSHLQALLDQVQSLTRRYPQASLAELIRTFEPAQRGPIYQALGARHVPESTTRWIAVVAGSEILLFDPRRPELGPERIPLGDRAGALRSLRPACDSRGCTVLLVGAARSTLIVDPRDQTVRSTHLAAAESPTRLRGGYNALCLTQDLLLGSHSELGLTRWELTDASLGQPVLPERCRLARAVRHVQGAGSALWLSIDELVLSLPLAECRAPQPRTQEYRGSRATITALLCTPTGVLAGNCDGEILSWNPQVPERPAVIHPGEGRAVESLAAQVLGGVDRLFFTNTSAAVISRIRGDSFSCRYEAGGQTLLRAWVGADLLVATNEGRDRLLCWPIQDPSAVPAVLPVAQLTGRSIQDVCLIPDSSAAGSPSWSPAAGGFD